MGIGGHHFLAAATILHCFYDVPTVGLVEATTQGYSSATYIATFSNGNSIILQFRPDNRLIDEECHKIARGQIGDLAPSARLLTKHENSILVYELSRIPGFPFCELHLVLDFVGLLLTVAEGFGRFLGKCYVEKSRCGTDGSWVVDVVGQLKKAAETSDPLLLSYKADFAVLLEGVQSGALDDLPLSITNRDMTSTNLMVTDKGVVTGLVDWEMMRIRPLGFDLGAIHWMKGSGLGAEYFLHQNADEIENRFWAAFMASIPQYAAKQLPTLQFKVSTVLSAVSDGECYLPPNISRLHAELDYTIPLSDAFSSG
jgi:hypothetical protein